jgi:SAM-dependent methyltransferase
VEDAPSIRDGGRLSSVVDQEFWEGFWEERPQVLPTYNSADIAFRDLFDAYFKPGGSCFEVGCYPGRFLIYLGKRFGYTANGIDWVPQVRTHTPEFLRQHEVRVGEFFCEDFERFHCDRMFDVVYSLGFIEHFWNLEKVIRKHVALVKPGGILFLACPNFRGLQFLFHRIFDVEDLRAHVLPTMNLRRWRAVLEQEGMEVLREGYYRTVGFWTNPEAAKGLSGSISGYLARLAEGIDKRLELPTPWLSPHMFSISRKVLDLHHPRRR